MLTPLINFAQTYTYTTSGTSGAAATGFGLVFWIVYLAILVLMLAAMWKIYTKAGKPGWAAIVPIYNVIVLLQIVEKPLWWIILFFIPIVNIVFSFLVALELAKKFGKDAGYAILLFFLPFIGYPLLGFGDAQYHGGSTMPAGAQPYGPDPASPTQPPQQPMPPTTPVQ